MAMLKPNTDDLVIFCDPESDMGKKTLALVQANKDRVNIQNIHVNEMSNMWLSIILTELGANAKDLMNRSHPYYQENVRGHDFDENGWLNILKKNPDLIRCPIVHYQGHSYLIETPTDLFKVQAHLEGK